MTRRRRRRRIPTTRDTPGYAGHLKFLGNSNTLGHWNSAILVWNQSVVVTFFYVRGNFNTYAQFVTSCYQSHDGYQVFLKSSKSTSLFQPYKHLSIVVTMRPFIFHTLEFHHVHILLSFYYKHYSIVSTVLIPIKNFLLQVPYNFNVGWLKIIRPTEWCSYQNQQSPVYDMKWGHFDRVKSTFKMLLSF